MELSENITHSINMHIEKRKLKRTLDIEEIIIGNALAESSSKRLCSIVVPKVAARYFAQDLVVPKEMFRWPVLNIDSHGTYQASTDEELPELDQDSIVPCWILQGVNLSAKLNEYRGKAIAKLRTQTLKDMESMALNHVYLFNDDLDYLGLNDVQVAALGENLNRNENYACMNQQDTRCIDYISHTAMIQDVETLKVVAAQDIGSAFKKAIHLIVDNLARFNLEKVD
ncbi:hypothetical protein V8B55DRAFT_1332337 [Mucor lusitanicus]|uniref:Uncharacterized protein n=1 Tax=Mucor lusitanicus CBS 277.49 TaxID=747725 RepID=A0A162Y7N8_MUCCL|nr:hypothetical protein MUCCIDRAFT_115846 [Mucor lusitanicus CBS 277.49]